MKGNYDIVAPFYDRFSRMVFGKSILQAQLFLLEFIPANSKILIVGGGTGWILEELAAIFPAGLYIAYVEVSEKMIELSKKRNYGSNEVVFINQPMQQVSFYTPFDVVITPFLFDNFNDKTAHEVFKKIQTFLYPHALWLLADFQVYQNRLWQKAILKMMYFFFKLTCNIEADSLPQTQKIFSDNRFTVVAERTFFKKFIAAGVYRKTLN